MSWFSRFFRRAHMEEQLEKELRFHLDQHESDLIARGRAPSEARREARLALGGPEQIKEKCRDARGARWLEQLLQDAFYAARAFRRKPGFPLVTLLILALGIGATTVMFAVVDSVLLRPLPFPNADRLVTLHGFLKEFGEFWGFSYPDFSDIRDRVHSLRVAGWTYASGTLGAPGRPEHVEARLISAGLFDVLGIAPVYGRAFRPDEDRPGATPVAMISYDLWQRRFAADHALIGRKLAFDGRVFQVVGVVPPDLQLSGAAQIFTPLGQSTDPRMQVRTGRFIQVIGRMVPGRAGLNQTQAELTLIARHLAEEYPKSNEGLEFRARPLLESLVKDVKGTLWLLLAAIGMVLVISCVNIASLFLTRAISREREMAMRAAIGAGRGRLIRQCITESAILGLCGGLLGILLALASLHPFISLWPGSLPRAGQIHIDSRVLLFSLAVSLGCGFLFGLTPAWRVPVHRLEEALRSGGRSVTANFSHLHGPFVVTEIALAFVLLVSAGMLGRTLMALSSLKPGFDAHNVLAARFALSPSVLDNPSQIRQSWREVLDRAQRLPGVESAALTDIIPMREGENVIPYRATPAPLPPDRQPAALASTVTPGYIKLMGIPLVAGRFFNEHDREGSQPVVVIDENLARHAFGRTDVAGRQIWSPTLGSAPLQIIGVVGHVRHWGLAGDEQSRVQDQMYYPFAQVPDRLLHFFSSVMSIVVRTQGSPVNFVQPLEQELRGASGDQTLYDVHSMDGLVTASLARQRFLSLLFAIFAGLALLLACIGIYGVLAYVTGQRTSEIGIRMAVGANVRDIMGLVLSQGMKMTAAGLALGIIGAFAAARILLRLVEGMQPAGTLIFAITIPALILAVFLASFFPARRAGMVDPVKALREE